MQWFYINCIWRVLCALINPLVYKNNNLSIKINLSHLVLQWIIFSLRLTQNVMQNAIKYSFTLKTNSHTLTIFKSHNIQRKCMSFDYMSLLGCWGKLKLSPVTMYNIKLLSLKKFRCSFLFFVCIRSPYLIFAFL